MKRNRSEDNLAFQSLLSSTETKDLILTLDSPVSAPRLTLGTLHYMYGLPELALHWL